MITPLVPPFPEESYEHCIDVIMLPVRVPEAGTTGPAEYFGKSSIMMQSFVGREFVKKRDSLLLAT